MTTDKYLSLEEARKQGLLDRFAKEHSSKGDKKKFDQLMKAMAKKSSKAGRTSK